MSELDETCHYAEELRTVANLQSEAVVKAFAKVVIESDGGETDPGPSDAILINAGVTHPRSLWLDSLRPGGRLLPPLTVNEDADGSGGSRFLKVTRQPGALRLVLPREWESSRAWEAGMPN